MEKITVVESVAGKFGPQIRDAKGYLSFGKFYKKDTAFPAGAVLDCDIFTTAKGNRYINSCTVVGQAEAVEAPKRGRKPTTKSAEDVVKALPATENKWQGRDFDKENRGKVKSLFLEACLSNPNLLQTINDIKLLNSSEVQDELNKLVETVF